jgi:hypothetical protein
MPNGEGYPFPEDRVGEVSLFLPRFIHNGMLVGMLLIDVLLKM